MSVVTRDALTSSDQDEMFHLMESHFDGVNRAQFERDLAAKHWVLLLRRQGRLVGFTTLRVSDGRCDGRELTAIYSGDTIMSQEAWNSPSLARSWIAAVNDIRKSRPGRPCYWLLLVSGFRTYRFLPVFWREFLPRHDAEPNPEKERLLQELARAEYGACFDEGQGVVRFSHPQRLRSGLSEITPGRERDPHVAFFLQRNPGHAQGDELVCLTEIDESNLTRAGWRMVKS